MTYCIVLSAKKLVAGDHLVLLGVCDDLPSPKQHVSGSMWETVWGPLFRSPYSKCRSILVSWGPLPLFMETMYGNTSCDSKNIGLFLAEAHATCKLRMLDFQGVFKRAQITICLKIWGPGVNDDAESFWKSLPKGVGIIRELKIKEGPDRPVKRILSIIEEHSLT